MEEIIKNLIKNNKTISVMESCTGGYISNSITNIEGSSEIFKFGAVTYSNQFKIKMGVNKNILDKYSVYSKETSIEMAKEIKEYTSSNISIGITGKLNKKDIYNNYGNDSEVFITIIEKDIYSFELEVNKETREENKKLVKEEIIKQLKTILKI